MIVFNYMNNIQKIIEEETVTKHHFFKNGESHLLITEKELKSFAHRILEAGFEATNLEDELKIIEAPSDIKRVSKEQAFVAGQMNMLLKYTQLNRTNQQALLDILKP